jgi:hypothetical protein
MFTEFLASFFNILQYPVIFFSILHLFADFLGGRNLSYFCCIVSAGIKVIPAAFVGPELKFFLLHRLSRNLS